MTAIRLSRRSLLKAGALAGASMSVPWRWLASATPARAATTVNLRKFVQPLRGVGAKTGVPLAVPDTVRQPWWQPGVTHYTIDLLQSADQLHPDLPNPTRLWGFGQPTLAPVRHLGGVIAVKRGTPVQITFRNKLPRNHILPVDRTLMGTEGQDNRADVHLHGGFVPWLSDGVPFAWWDPNGNKGPSFVNNAVLRPGQSVPSNEAEYYYPNDQSARLMWYHDHALGITRLNAYAGIATGYVVYDDYELALTLKPYNLPGPLDPRTVYLVFQDKVFVPADVASSDPTWANVVANTRPGDLWYPHIYDAEVGPQPAGPPPDPSCVPESFGDTMLVNGTVYPYLEVEQRQYRLRMLNACQARFVNPRLVYAQGATFPADSEPRLPLDQNLGPAFVQIGNEGGFLPAPVYLSGASPLLPPESAGPSPNQLLLAPAERADVIVDFRDVPAGSRLLLVADAPGPYPAGDPPVVSLPGFGPDTRTILQVRVKARAGGADAAISLPKSFTPTDPFLVRQTPGQPTKNPGGARVRRLTLNEVFDDFGRLIQFLGTDTPTGPASDDPGLGREYFDMPTEIVKAGSTEVWEILNITGDTHPIHFHLVNVQVLSRQPFDEESYAGGVPTLTGPAIAPDDNELGWKETIRMNPGEVTRVLIKFRLPAVPFTVPASPRLAADYDGLSGAEYVWHCHILEHEEHDMMRPVVVV